MVSAWSINLRKSRTQSSFYQFLETQCHTCGSPTYHSSCISSNAQGCVRTTQETRKKYRRGVCLQHKTTSTFSQQVLSWSDLRNLQRISAMTRAVKCPWRCSPVGIDRPSLYLSLERISVMSLKQSCPRARRRKLLLGGAKIIGEAEKSCQYRLRWDKDLSGASRRRWSCKGWRICTRSKKGLQNVASQDAKAVVSVLHLQFGRVGLLNGFWTQDISPVLQKRAL